MVTRHKIGARERRGFHGNGAGNCSFASENPWERLCYGDYALKCETIAPLKSSQGITEKIRFLTEINYETIIQFTSLSLSGSLFRSHSVTHSLNHSLTHS